MLDSKLAKLKELIETKEKVDAEIETLLGASLDAPKRGRPRKPNGESSGVLAEPEQTVESQ